MAASSNNPRLSNPIKSDVPEIQQKEAALLKMDPTNVSDLEVGAKRLTEISSGNWQFQTWNGSQWVNVGKLKMDVDTVDGYDASITPKANTVAVRGSDGKLKDSITGNATTADSAVTLSETLVVGKGGTGATTAEQARSNLGVPPTSHASANTTYGVSSAKAYGHAKASSDAPAQDTDAGAVGKKTSEFARGDHSHKKVLGNADTYGQVKLTDSVSDGSDASSSVAASAKAVKDAYDKAEEAATTLMTGATADTPGTSGRVPAPAAGDQNKAFFGDGTYKDVVRSVGGSTPDANGNVNAPYLPLTGGTLKGNLRFNIPGTEDYIGNIMALNDQYGKRIIIDTYEEGDHGAYISLRKGSDTINPGGFDIAVRNSDGSIARSLYANIGGNLLWDGKQIVRSVNGVGADANGNVSLNIAETKVNNAGYADSAGSASVAHICKGVLALTGAYLDLPNYGAWGYIVVNEHAGVIKAGGANGGTRIYSSSEGDNKRAVALTIRIS